MAASRRGLYEILVTEAVASGLRELDASLEASTGALRPAEAADRVALHLSRIVQRAIAGVPDAERVRVGVGLARRIVEQIEEVIVGAEVRPDAPVEPATVLRAIAGRQPDGRPETIPEPLIPLLDTTLRPRSRTFLLTSAASARLAAPGWGSAVGMSWGERTMRTRGT
ncbi:hypothetical protein [Sorangium sp. So ce1099]|uniref:hypothetical protein n=1 Tax=Sorangium sp. So ce1099 TaxID=3133331 RepID=UPI003F62D9A5